MLGTNEQGSHPFWPVSLNDFYMTFRRHWWAIAYTHFKEIVHFEINFWYVLAYLKGIQDVGVFVSTVFSIELNFNWYF